MSRHEYSFGVDGLPSRTQGNYGNATLPHVPILPFHATEHETCNYVYGEPGHWIRRKPIIWGKLFHWVYLLALRVRASSDGTASERPLALQEETCAGKMLGGVSILC